MPPMDNEYNPFQGMYQDSYSGMLGDLYEQSTRTEEGVTSQRRGLADELEHLDYSSPGKVGASMVLPALIGAALGGSRGLASGFGGAAWAGQFTENNLEKDEQERRKFLDREIDRADKEADRERAMQQFLMQSGLQHENQYLMGSFPGTGPYQRIQADTLGRQLAAQKNAHALQLEELRRRGLLDPGSKEWETRQADELAQAEALANARYKANPLYAPISDDIADLAKLPHGINPKEATIIQRGVDLDQRKVEGERRREQRAAYLAQNKVAGVGLLTPVVPSKFAENQAKLTAGYDGTVAVQDMLIDLLKTKGVSWLGEDSKDRAALFSRWRDAYRQSEGAGANFTIFEMDLADARNADIGTFSKWLEAQVRGYGSPEAMASFLEREKARNTEVYAQRLTGWNGYLVGHRYDPETAARKGIPVDQNGVAQDNGVLDQYVSRHYPDAMAKGAPAAKDPVLEELRARQDERRRQLEEMRQLLIQRGGNGSTP